MNWPEAYAYLQNCPPAKAKEQLLRLVMGKCRVKPVRAKIRLPRGVKKKESIPKLKKELDRVFSIFIRQRDSMEHSGFGKCSTCNHVAHWKEMDCGHYVPRQDLATRWDERNCHLQCKSCNGFRGGEAEKMAAYIDAKYGTFNALNLRNMHKQKFRLTRDWLEMKIRVYKALVGEAPPKAEPVSPKLPPTTQEGES